MQNHFRTLSFSSLVLLLISLFSCEEKDVVSTSQKAYFRDRLVPGTQVQDVPKGSATRWIYIEYIGDWSISTEYADGDTAWCTIASESGTNDAILWVNISENKAAASRKVVFKVKLGDKILPLVIEQSGINAKEPKGLYSNMVEVPAFKETDKIKFMSHSMKVDGETMRNYTVLYDTENLYPIWVAYPHNHYGYGVSGRTNAWEYDPNLGKHLQPNLYRGIGGGYDRGHMLPSFVRTATVAMNEQTFYFTNMSAQLAGFNQKKWLRTEEHIKKFRGSGSDTLFVVTGCVLQTIGGNEKIIKVKNKNDGKSMAVPNYYYKVLLKRYGNGTNKAIAFWMEHKNASGKPTASDTHSVRWVEEKTGINFFANLPQDLQDEFENQHRPAEWDLKN